MSDRLFDLAQNAKAWPFEQARELIKRLNRGDDKKEVFFQTGYGPSGLPHIGTFGEVARTSMVRHAFEVLTHHKCKTRLICFSDDMDGLRKVPDNVPNKQALMHDLGKPLTRVADPFGTHESFAHHNNVRLRSFLDKFGFDYEFYSSTQMYQSGRFDDALKRMLDVYDDIMDIILPTLGPDRRASYSPFLPICPRTGVVLQVPIIDRDCATSSIRYKDPQTGDVMTTPVTGGAVKCQWKADWALRWYALDIDYEMAGKDLADSVRLSSRIVKALGGIPPTGFNYELFLDEKGEKISKSKGNGLTIEQWLTYASPQSLSLFMYQKPKTAKKLYFDIIPKTMDEYFTWVAKFDGQQDADKLENPIFHIHNGVAPKIDMPLNFALLLNLVSAANAVDKKVLWGFIRRYAPNTSPQTHPALDEMVGYAVRYFTDFVKPNKKFRSADEEETRALQALSDRLTAYDVDATDGEALQNIVFAVGKECGFEPLRNWFKAIYQILLGQDHGPRFGSFIALYGVKETRLLIAKALAGDLAKE